MREDEKNIAVEVALDLLSAHIPDLDKGAIDDTDYVHLVGRVASVLLGIFLKHGSPKHDAESARDAVVRRASDLFVQLWLEQAKVDSDEVDLIGETREARAVFENYLKKLHPK